MIRRICFVFIIVVSLLCVFQSCESQFEEFEEYELTDEETDRARLSAMRNEIIEMIGEANCSNSLNCKYVPFGVKPCGGPWTYLIYSVTTVNENELFRRIQEYNCFNDTLNKEYGWCSDCSIEPAPTVGCRNGYCVDLNTQ